MKLTLTHKVLFGVILGILTGLFLGNYTAVLLPVGDVYVMLMQAVVYPYIIASLIAGLGTLSPVTSRQVLKQSWPLYLFVIIFLSLFIGCLSFGIPESPSKIITATVTQASFQGFLQSTIPENLFTALANNYIPAVVIFCLLFGIALQHYKHKKTILESLEAVKYTCNKVWSWIIYLSPYGVFALVAYTAGTIDVASLKGVVVYLLLFFIGAIMLSLWLLPAIISSLTMLSYKEIISYFRNALLIAVTTTLSVAAIPYIEENLKKILIKHRIGQHDQEREDIIGTASSLSYPLGQFGNLFLYLFVIFAGWYFQRTINLATQPSLLMLNFFSSIGTPSSSINSAAFLARWANLPANATNLYVELMALTRYGQVLLSAMGMIFLSILVTLAYFRYLKVQWRRLLFHVCASFILVAAIILVFRNIDSYIDVQRPSLLNFTLDPALTKNVTVNIASQAVPQTVVDNNSALYQIRKTGVLRVGFNPHMIPFIYFNNQHQLVGYDVAYMYALAKTLGVHLQFIPFDFNDLVADIQADQFDIAIGSIYVTPERLLNVAYTRPYFDDVPALIVRKPFSKDFLNLAAIQKIPHLKIAVFNDPVMLPLARINFPAADLIVIPHNDDLTHHPEADAALWTEQHTQAWVSVHPGYVSVVPTGLKAGMPLFMAFMLNKNEQDLLWYINYWLAIEQNDGFQQQQYRQWILGELPRKQQLRWSIGHNILHWW